MIDSITNVARGSAFLKEDLFPSICYFGMLQESSLKQSEDFADIKEEKGES